MRKAEEGKLPYHVGQHRVASVRLESSREDRIAGRAENWGEEREEEGGEDRAASEAELPGWLHLPGPVLYLPFLG